MTCATCGRPIEDGKFSVLVGGVRMCASHVMQIEEVVPEPKRLAANWQAFSTAKRRNRRWR